MKQRDFIERIIALPYNTDLDCCEVFVLINGERYPVTDITGPEFGTVVISIEGQEKLIDWFRQREDESTNHWRPDGLLEDQGNNEGGEGSG